MPVFESSARWLSQKTNRQVSADVLRAWWVAARPAYYIATLIPLFVGFVAAGKDMGQWRVGLFLVIASIVVATRSKTTRPLAALALLKTGESALSNTA